MQERMDVTHQINFIGKSSMSTIQSVLLSVIMTQDVGYIKSKLKDVKQVLTLTEVEKQVIKDIETTIDVSGVVSAEYIQKKFSYYFEAAPHQIIEKSQVDYAIIDIKVNEDKNKLSRNLLTLANEIDGLTSTEIKQRIETLTQASVLTQQHIDTLDNGLQLIESAYDDLIGESGVYSMLLREVEKHAGKAGVGHVISILGFVGSFKSTYALNMAYDNAINGVNTLYLSLESTEKAMVSRLVLNHIATHAKDRNQMIRQSDLRDGKLSVDQQKHYNDKHNELVTNMGNNFIMWDSVKIRYHTFMDMTNTLRAADEMFKQKTGRGLEMLYVDQLALLKHTDPMGTGKRYSYAGAIMDEWMTYFRQQTLNFMGDGRQITSVIVSQVRREAYAEASKAKNKGKYDASAGGDSNEIERTSDTIITLYKDMDTKNTLLVHVPKARHGSNPDEPIQVEVYGDYFHVGPLDNLDGTQISMDAFTDEKFSLADLLKV